MWVPSKNGINTQVKLELAYHRYVQKYEISVVKAIGIALKFNFPSGQFPLNQLPTKSTQSKN